MKKSLAILSLLLTLALSGTSLATDTLTNADDEKDIYAISDPLEGFNRVIFKFNDTVDIYILSPVARGYRSITNKSVRKSINSAFSNLKEPMSAINYLLQAKPKESITSVGRFAVNSTLGLAGLFDVAEGWGWKNEVVGFDRTLATWCVPDGPYLVIPLLGPSTPRGAIGEVADYFSHPVYWATTDHEDGMYASMAFSAARAVVSREALLDLTDDFRRNSVDYYATMRAAFIQNRSGYNCSAKGTSPAANYDFDFTVE